MSLPEFDAIICQKCKNKLAEIFQVTGDFCTECWMEITHPEIRVRNIRHRVIVPQ